ncbi:hypothetical protein [Streptomyces sp. NPDC090036]|uniref:hypothetical protein n=1 Tax=Streptomyces sp. NPDC090036 TaxID=3365926 RepID=UPI0037F86E67
MAGAEARLDEAGVALWLTEWKVEIPVAWTPRRVLALVGGERAGRLDFLVHPDGQAVSVWAVEVEHRFQRRNVGAVMTDALCAAHPTAWIDHGGREADGVRWWDRYTDPAQSDQDPATWMPMPAVHCRYLGEWVATKHRWGLAVDPAEREALLRYAADCPHARISLTGRRCSPGSVIKTCSTSTNWALLGRTTSPTSVRSMPWSASARWMRW